MFDWKDYLHLAEDLTRDGGDEAKRRAAVSRAYYAAFCAARKHAGMENDRVEKIHKAVIDKYYYSPLESDRYIGGQLKNIKGYRISADYYASEDVKIESVDDSIERVKKIFEVIETGQLPY